MSLQTAKSAGFQRTPIQVKAMSGLVASACAGVLENYGFHPLDTVVKRLQADRSKERYTRARLNQIIFQNSCNKGPLAKYKSLFPGLRYAVAYKIFQRTYKFGTQPIIRELVSRAISRTSLSSRLGASRTRMLCDGLSGAIVGAGEILLLPLDAIKIRKQAAIKGKDNNKNKKKNDSDDYKNLYSGLGWTVARNVPGSFALFGVSSFVKERVLGVKGGRGSVVQNFVASLAGSVASILVSAPMDTMKVRAQIGKSTSVAEFVRNEGFLSLWKGTGVKLVTATPRLIFAFTVSQVITQKLEAKIIRVFTK